ncbi:LLM class flavin-dependent oxidoreductase [Sphaerisporangium perillae]|uniref:LLM class flavin-dependent oxidoreductase n=1 Tax=Sphaerisporangium perillae TaxID=2935860 RepID=UPI00355828EC
MDKTSRYERADEFLHVVRALWSGETVDFTGRHIQIEGGRIPRVPDPLPPIYFGGSSGPAGPVAALRCLPHLGRAARGGRRHARVDQVAGGRAGPHAAVRPSTPPASAPSAAACSPSCTSPPARTSRSGSRRGSK